MKNFEGGGARDCSCRNQARRELKACAADLAVTLAAARIQVDVSADEELLRPFIDQLGRNSSD